MNENENAVPVQTETSVGAGNYRQRAVAELSKPPAPPKERETKQERKERQRREAVQTIKERAAADNALVLEARESFGAAERESRRVGRPVTWPYVQETVQRVLSHVERAIPLDDYSEFPGAPERPGACTLSGVPCWAFRRWMEGENGATTAQGEMLRSSLARAREVAADTLADRHLHLARVALEVPWASDAVRVAADILRWQASIRKPATYSDRQTPQAPARQVLIQIGTTAPVKVAVSEPKLIEGEVVTETSQPVLQAPDATG